MIKSLKRLFVSILILISVLCFGCILSIFAGRTDTHPDNLQLIGFDLCGGQPCFKGIIPGVTTWEQAKPNIGSIANHDFLVDSTSGASQGNVGVYIASDARTVGLVQQTVYNIRLLDVIQKYGVPCSVSMSGDTTYTYAIIMYPRMEIFVSIKSERLEPLSSVTLISMGDKPLPCSEPISWKGFIGSRHYDTLLPQ